MQKRYPKPESVRFLMCIIECSLPCAYSSFQASNLPTQQKVYVIELEGNLDHEWPPWLFKPGPPLPAMAVNAQFRQPCVLGRDSFVQELQDD